MPSADGAMHACMHKLAISVGLREEPGCRALLTIGERHGRYPAAEPNSFLCSITAPCCKRAPPRCRTRKLHPCRQAEGQAALRISPGRTQASWRSKVDRALARMPTGSLPCDLRQPLPGCLPQLWCLRSGWKAHMPVMTTRFLGSVSRLAAARTTTEWRPAGCRGHNARVGECGSAWRDGLATDDGLGRCKPQDQVLLPSDSLAQGPLMPVGRPPSSVGLTRCCLAAEAACGRVARDCTLVCIGVDSALLLWEHRRSGPGCRRGRRWCGCANWALPPHAVQ